MCAYSHWRLSNSMPSSIQDYWILDTKMMVIRLMEKILHHSRCPIKVLIRVNKYISGILSGAGFFPSTVLLFDLVRNTMVWNRYKKYDFFPVNYVYLITCISMSKFQVCHLRYPHNNNTPLPSLPTGN